MAIENIWKMFILFSMEYSMLVLLERTTLKTNMTMETQPFEDACAIKNGDFPASHVSFFLEDTAIFMTSVVTKTTSVV